MNLSLNALKDLFPQYRGEVDQVNLKGVFTDSRKDCKKGLFVPIVGAKFDGHEFLKDAIYNGAIASLWQKDLEIPAYVPNHFPLFLVEDTLEALQNLAQYYLHTIKPKVVGITGSNGKTTTKDLVDSVLSQKYVTHKTKGNYNNHIGLPLTILDMPSNTEIIILEMGMNHFGEISFLSKLSTPDYAIITNIGESHIEYLGSREGIAKAKLEILDGLKEDGILLIDGDEPLLTEHITNKKVVRCGVSEESDLTFIIKHASKDGITFTINDKEDHFSLPMLGEHNVKNSVYAIALAKELSLTPQEIKKGLEDARVTGMRLERFKGKNNSLLINDAYNASPTSMKAAIESIKALSDYSQKILVLGNMYELGNEEEALHRDVANVINSPITKLVAIGEKAGWIADELKKVTESVEVFTFESKEEVSKKLELWLTDQTVILFKASRLAKLETIVDELKE